MTTAGVAFPSVDGKRKTSITGRAIVADAARSVDDRLAETIEGTQDWRGGYVDCLHELTATSGRSARGAVAMAEAGLASARSRMTFVRGDDELALGEALGLPAAAVHRAVTIEGRGTPVDELTIPYRGEQLRGERLDEQLTDWVDRGVVEPSMAEAVRRVAAHPEWLRLEGRRVALFGAGAEMGPLGALLDWGVHVLAVDIPRPAVWQRIIKSGRERAGTLTVPVAGATEAADDAGLAKAAGLDLAQDLPETRAWLLEAAGGDPLVLAMHCYADGAAHVEVTLAADALAADLLATSDDVALAYLATPTDSYLVPRDIVTASLRRWSERGRLRSVLQAPLQAGSLGRLFQRNYAHEVPCDDGARWGVADVIVPQQGPNYALAKRLQRWRGMLAWHEGRTVSFNVAPASWTQSVTKNRVLAAAYAGARHFGVEIFAPETTRVLMAALLVHDLEHRPAAPAAHPETLFVENAAHGGLWRVPYEPRSALGVAALAGISRAVRPS